MEHFSLKIFMQHLDTAIVFLAILSFSEQFFESIVTYSFVFFCELNLCKFFTHTRIMSLFSWLFWIFRGIFLKAFLHIEWLFLQMS